MNDALRWEAKVQFDALTIIRAVVEAHGGKVKSINLETREVECEVPKSEEHACAVAVEKALAEMGIN